MLDAILSKRYIFKGSIHSPTPGDTHIVSEEPKGFDKFYEQETKRRYESSSRFVLDSQSIDKRSKILRFNSIYQNTVWKTRALRILYFVSKFLSQLKQNTDKIKFKMLDRKIFDVIDDRASDFEFYIRRKLINKNVSFLTYLLMQVKYSLSYLPIQWLNKIPVIYPDSTLRIAYDSLLVFSVILNIFYIPLNLAFDLQISDSETFVFEQIPSWLLLFEIVLNFNTAFYQEGIIHVDRDDILKYYIQRSFIWDFMNAIPFALKIFNKTFANYLTLLRIVRIKQKFEHIEASLNLRERFSGILDLVRLVFFVLVVSHFCACFWYFIATSEEQAGISSWLTAKQIVDANLKTQYISSLYFCTITITTVGYGDITPSTSNEMIFTIMMTLVTCGVFGYAINNIGNIFQEMERKKQNVKNHMAKVNYHLKRHSISQQLSLQIRKYFEFYFQGLEEDDKEIEKWLEILPNELRRQLQIDKYKKILLRSKFIREHLSVDCVDLLCQKVVEQEYQLDDVLFRRNEQPRRLYFIEIGEVKLVLSKKQVFQKSNKTQIVNHDTVLRRFKSGYVLGEKNFLLDREMDYQAQAFSRCMCIQVSFDNFIDALKSYPQDYEKYCLMRDTLLLDQQYRKVVTVCEICGYNHSFKSCPFPFFSANKYKVIQKLRRWDPQDRLDCKRRSLKSQEDAQLIKYCALCAAIDSKKITEDEITLQKLSDYGLNLSNNALEQNESNQILSFESVSEKSESSSSSIDLATRKVRKKARLSTMNIILSLVKSKRQIAENTARNTLTPNRMEGKSDTQLPQAQTLIDLSQYFEPPDFEGFKIYQLYKPQFNLDIILQEFQIVTGRDRSYKFNFLSDNKNQLINRVFQQIKNKKEKDSQFFSDD